MSYKPGCFGSPLCHGMTTPVCQVCPFRTECGNAAAACADRLRQTYRIDAAFKTPPPKRRFMVAKASAAPTGISAPPRPRPTVPVMELQEPPAELPKKGWELVESLRKRGIDLGRALEMRANPFDLQPPRHMRVLFGMLIKGGFTRIQAKQSLMTDLGWTEASASSNAGSAIAAMVHLGVAIEQEGRVMPVMN